MHYLTDKISKLPDEEKNRVIAELLATISTVPATTAEQISLVLMSEFTDEATERMKHFGKMQGLSSGYHSIDELTKGFVGGELTIIAGKTSYGKTSLAMNMANKIALNGHTVLFVTMEMTHAELTSRYMFINGGGQTEDYDRVASLTVFQKNDELDWQSIDGLIERARQQMGVEFVVIDHLHYFTRELANVAEDLGRITKELKKNAQRHNIPIALISHVRKTFQNEEASMDDLRGSSYIGQDADIVLMVGRDSEDESKIYIKVEKNRNRGYDYKQNVATLNFDKTKITEPERVYEQPFQD